MATDKVKLTKCQINLVGRYQFHSQDFLASFPGSLLKTRKGRSLVTSVGKVVDFRCLVLAVPIRLQNRTTCTRDICPLSKNCQLENELISADYTSKVSEKQFSGVWKEHKSRESKNKVHCGLQDRLTHHTL